MKDPATPNNKESRRPRLMFIAIIVCVVVIVGFLVLSALAQSPPIEMRNPAQVTKTQGRANTPTNPQPRNGQTQGNGQMQGNAPNWVPQQLPGSWTAAGLSTSDAVEASRTAITFTDREMSLDFRSAGTRNNHGGTFTAATFLLTPAGMQRFQQNDLRVINNTLWDNVQQEKLVQSVVNAQPLLFMALSSGQGQPFFAWVDVSFQLYQSKLGGNGKPVEGFEIDPNLNAPRLHHMVVLLVRVPPQNAGANPAMGGTGWLVSTYALDLPAGNTVGVTMQA
jgi:hypothetical protein